MNVTDVALLKKEAKNKKTSPSRLEELARHADSSVQFAVAGEILSVKRPVRMRVQFLKAFVEAINRQEKRFGVGGVNRDWHLVRACCLPHRIEATIINFDQLARRHILAQIQTERLQNLDAFGSELFRAFDLFGLKLRIIRLDDFAEPGFGKD